MQDEGCMVSELRWLPTSSLQPCRHRPLSFCMGNAITCYKAGYSRVCSLRALRQRITSASHLRLLIWRSRGSGVLGAGVPAAREVDMFSYSRVVLMDCTRLTLFSLRLCQSSSESLSPTSSTGTAELATPVWEVDTPRPQVPPPAVDELAALLDGSSWRSRLRVCRNRSAKDPLRAILLKDVDRAKVGTNSQAAAFGHHAGVACEAAGMAAPSKAVAASSLKCMLPWGWSKLGSGVSK